MRCNGALCCGIILLSGTIGAFRVGAEILILIVENIVVDTTPVIGEADREGEEQARKVFHPSFMEWLSNNGNLYAV